MRIFEAILLLLCIVFIILPILFKNRASKKIELSIIVFFLITHLIFEGYRWQMIPTYCILLIVLFSIYKQYLLIKGNWISKSIILFFLFLFLLIGYTLPTVLPVFTLLKPTGNYKIGSKYIHLKTERDEDITKNLNDKRELMIKVWYPAIIKNEKKEPYLNEGDRISFAKKYGLPKTTFKYLNYIETNTYLAPKVANEKFPVLIFSHGYYSKASGYYAVIEEIVSKGYIVFNINHTYESTGTLFPDKSLKLYNLEYDKNHISNKKMAEMAWKMRQAYTNAKNEKERLIASDFALKNYFSVVVCKRWSKDISTVINNLENWNKNSFLKNHLDISKIGVFGHSQGGSSAGQAILDDKRITAGINIDGIQWGNMIDSVLTKPFLNISSDWKYPHPNYNKYAYKNGSTAVFYNAKIIGTGHSNFMDIPLIINTPFLSEAGKINVKKAYEITSFLTTSFFDITLKNKKLNLLKRANTYKNLKLTKN